MINYWLRLIGKHLHGLAHAASGYQRVLEENRKLYNQVQDLKGDIEWFEGYLYEFNKQKLYFC